MMRKENPFAHVLFNAIILCAQSQHNLAYSFDLAYI